MSDMPATHISGSSLIAVVKLALFVSLVRLMVLFEVGISAASSLVLTLDRQSCPMSCSRLPELASTRTVGSVMTAPPSDRTIW